MSYLRDEQGKHSAARILLVCVVAHILAFAWIGTLQGRALDPAMWSVLSTLAIALAAWAGGPRVIRYLGGQVGRVASGVASAASGVFGRWRVDHNVFLDDERGEEWRP